VDDAEEMIEDTAESVSCESSSSCDDESPTSTDSPVATTSHTVEQASFLQFITRAFTGRMCGCHSSWFTSLLDHLKHKQD